MCNGHSDVLVDTGTKIIGVDRCIAPLIKALNDAGYRTLASCCGHGRLPATVPLVDPDGNERWLILTKDRVEGESMMAPFYATNSAYGRGFLDDDEAVAGAATPTGEVITVNIGPDGQSIVGGPAVAGSATATEENGT